MIKNNNNNNNALLSKLDALIEQVKLTNVLLGAQSLGDEIQRDLMLNIKWQRDTKDPERKEYLTLLGVFRKADDNAH